MEIVLMFIENLDENNTLFWHSCRLKQGSAPWEKILRTQNPYYMIFQNEEYDVFGFGSQ